MDNEEGKTLEEWLKGPNAAIYSSHFLASWSGRMFAFSMGLMFISISPTSLQLTATHGLCIGASVLVFGALIGDWVDRTPRLKAAIVSMVLQNLLMIGCAIVILVMLFLQSDIDDVAGWLRKLFYAIIIALSVTSRLMKVARVIVVERDWIVEISHRDENHLSVMTSSFRRIDLLTKILAPIVAGQIMTYAGLKVGCGFIVIWNLLSLAIETWLIRRVYRIVPELHQKKDLTRNDEFNTTIETDCAEAKALRNLDEKQGQEPSIEPVVGKSNEGCSWSRLWASMTSLYRGFRTYTSYDVKWAGFGLACLYLTVLGFDGITVGYATTQGLSGSILGIMLGVGAGIGIIATFTYPFILRHLGLPKTGVLALGLQVSSLTLCVISVWLPGSPFDLTYTEADKNTSLCRSNNGSLTLLGANTTISSVFPTEGLHNILYSSSNVTDFKNWNELSAYSSSSEFYSERLRSSTNQSSSSWLINHALNSSEPVNATSEESVCESEDDVGTRSKISVWVMLTGIVLARYGLWTADLVIIQLFLESVKPSERGIVNGFQSSLNQLMDFCKYALVVFISHPHQFGLLIFFSFICVSSGWGCMIVYAVKAIRREKRRKRRRPMMVDIC